MASTYDSFNALFVRENAKFAQKALDYFDGKIHNHTIELLDSESGRKNWKSRGMRVIYRNITNKIVSKSGLLFIHGAPTQEVFIGDQVNDMQTSEYNAILNDADFNEFMINFDSLVRLLKTAMILVQYDEVNNSIILEALHRGNSYVEVNAVTKRPETLIYKTYTDEEGTCYYRVITDEKIETWREDSKAGSKPVNVSSEDNPYDAIPLSIFYDTHTPRTGYWVEAPRELVAFNESLNLHMVDTEFAASWSVHQSLYTNMIIDGDDSGDYEGGEASAHQPLPRGGNQESSVMSGLGSVTYVDSTGVESPFLEYKSASIDLTQAHNVFADWVKDLSADWSVRARTEGDGSGVSGFSLVVREIDNLELRSQRQRMFERGLKQLYHNISIVWNTYHAGTFSDDSFLSVDFSKPKLPFEQKENEDIWNSRIEGKRASVIDYLMDEHSITREEAVERQKQINADNGIKTEVVEENQ